MSNIWSFLFGFGITSTGEKEHGGSARSVPLNICFLRGTSECAAVLGVITHPDLTRNSSHKKHMHRQKLLVVYHWSTLHHTSLTHAGPDLGHRLLLQNNSHC